MFGIIKIHFGMEGVTMQYGIDISTYKRTNKRTKEKKEIKIKISPQQLLLGSLSAFLITRVVINFSLSPMESIAPFGIAYLMANLGKSKKISISAAFGVLVGYLTLFRTVDNMPVYLITLSILVLMDSIPINIKKKYMYINFFIVFICYFGYGVLMNHYGLGVNLVTSIIETALVYPIYYILNYGLKCLGEINTQHYFTNEELVSISILLCFIIAGIGNVTLKGVDIRNIIAMAFVITIAYVTGSGMGAASGLVMGLILGITSDNFLLLISVYGTCGMVAGIFKDTGKVLSSLAFIIMFLILSLYCKNFTVFKLIEVVISAVIFIAIPSKVYLKFLTEFDNDVKQDSSSELHFNKIKGELTDRLRDFTDVLSTMSVALNNLVDNDRLLLKNKSTALIENLADRTCGNCDMKHVCWKRELHSTYSGFSELIKNYEESKNEFPLELERKCVKKFTLIKNTEEILSNYMMNEILRKRLSEGRKMLAGHINNMSVTVGEIVDDFNKDLSICGDIEKTIRKALARNNVKFHDILCYNDKNGRLNIKVDMDNCSGSQYCVKDLLPVINNTVGKTMSVGGEGCSIEPLTNKCSVLIEEAPKYHIASNVAISIKEGEKYTGDSYSFGKTKDGHYMVVVSDGMGSGPQAGVQSKAAVELIEKFTEAGFDELTAIDTINSIMSIKFSEDEKFSTLDMQKIDLYNGNVNFIKVGAVESFIKRGNKVEVIKSKTLPFGVLEAPDIDIIQRNVMNGDMIITISDGVLDINKDGTLDTDWLVQFIKYTKHKHPKDLSLAILEKAKELSGGKSRDDMTVVVSKVFALY